MRVKMLSLYLYIPMFIIMLADMLFTTNGNLNYFFGALKEPNEANPVWRYFMMHGFWAYAASNLAYMIVWLAIVCLLPHGIKLASFLIVTLAHSHAVAGWLQGALATIICGNDYVTQGCGTTQMDLIYILKSTCSVVFSLISAAFLYLYIRKRYGSAT